VEARRVDGGRRSSPRGLQARIRFEKTTAERAKISRRGI
jgi:hypothetical protein